MIVIAVSGPARPKRRSDETWNDWAERYRARVEEFRNAEVSIDVFRANLHSLGFTAREMETEINEHWTANQRSLARSNFNRFKL